MKVYINIILMFLAGCTSNREAVTIKQVSSMEKPVIIRISEDRAAIHSILYPLSYEIKKNINEEIYYFDNTFVFHNFNLSSGTGGCYLVAQDNNKRLSLSCKRFDGVIKYIIEENDTINGLLHDYYEEMRKDKKDTIHITAKDFKNQFGDIVDKYFDGDSIVLHFKKGHNLYNVPLEVSY